jgi:hypothetical protein
LKGKNSLRRWRQRYGHLVASSSVYFSHLMYFYIYNILCRNDLSGPSKGWEARQGNTYCVRKINCHCDCACIPAKPSPQRTVALRSVGKLGHCPI